MNKLLSILICLLLVATVAVAGTTTWTNAQGQTVTGNWSAGGVVEITTAEQYAEAQADPQPGVSYRVAPWLYDTHNLAAESGGDK